MSDIPIVVPCYENAPYVQHTIDQLLNINENFKIIILDNSPVVHVFDRVQVVHSPQNEGPWVIKSRNKILYDSLSNYYIITDPDLQFHNNLPVNFVDQLLSLSKIYTNYHKIGMALDISEKNLMYDYRGYMKNEHVSIVSHESQFWSRKIQNDSYELYDALIDTTFALYNKSAREEDEKHMRVAGNFTARHLPWYIDNPVVTKYQQLQQYKSSKYSNIGGFFHKMLAAKNIMAIKKRNVEFLVEKNENQHFWSYYYPTWEENSFNVYDSKLRPNGVMIDIGAWNGCTCLYAINFCKRVIAVEADKVAFQRLRQNVELNDANDRITIVNRAVSNKKHGVVKFGRNVFMKESSLNDSTSQIHSEGAKSDKSIEYNLLQTITPLQLIQQHVSQNEELCLVKVDIEGGEEMILNDLWQIKTTYNVPVYVAFHLNWWEDKNLSRFSFLSVDQQTHIEKNPFCEILFE